MKYLKIDAVNYLGQNQISEKSFTGLEKFVNLESFMVLMEHQKIKRDRGVFNKKGLISLL